MPRATTWMSHSTWSAGSGALSTELAHSHMVAGSFSRSSGALSRATVDKGTNNITEALANKSCTPCRGGVPPLTREQAEILLAQAPDWQLSEETHHIERSFRFSCGG